MSAPLQNFIERGRAAIASFAEAQVRDWIQTHRSELIAAIEQAQSERGAWLLHSFCNDYPAMAFVVTMLMGGTVENAIENVARFDPATAEAIAKNRGNFEKLQAHWRQTSGK